MCNCRQPFNYSAAINILSQKEINFYKLNSLKRLELNKKMYCFSCLELKVQEVNIDKIISDKDYYFVRFLEANISDHIVCQACTMEFKHNYKLINRKYLEVYCKICFNEHKINKQVWLNLIKSNDTCCSKCVIF